MKKIYDEGLTPVEAFAADTAKLKACGCADCAVATELQALEADRDRLRKLLAEVLALFEPVDSWTDDLLVAIRKEIGS